MNTGLLKAIDLAQIEPLTRGGKLKSFRLQIEAAGAGDHPGFIPDVQRSNLYLTPLDLALRANARHRLSIDHPMIELDPSRPFQRTHRTVRRDLRAERSRKRQTTSDIRSQIRSFNIVGSQRELQYGVVVKSRPARLTGGQWSGGESSLQIKRCFPTLELAPVDRNARRRIASRCVNGIPLNQARLS